MQQVVIIGAGRIGVAVGALLAMLEKYKLTIIDANESALMASRVHLPNVETLHARTAEELATALRDLKPWATVCATPYHLNVSIAQLCDELGSHYIDFTEDNSVTRGIVEINPTKSTFVLQTGLAPGLVNSVGKYLITELAAGGLTPTVLKMRVGALPVVAEFPGAYRLTWSSAGLINEYYQPVYRVVGGEVQQDEPLTDLEELMIDGMRLEAFNTSGGLGDPSMYEGLSTVDYKTLRYPGHFEFLNQNLVEPLKGLTGEARIDRGVQIVESLFPYTRQDVVYMAVMARAVDSLGKTIELTFQHKFYGEGSLTALEYTTAGTGAAVVDLLDTLPNGVVFGGNIRLHDILSTELGRALFAKDFTKL